MNTILILFIVLLVIILLLQVTKEGYYIEPSMIADGANIGDSDLELNPSL